MSSVQNNDRPSYVEFIIIISWMMSLTAFSIDAMLPALPQIDNDVGVQNPNDRQLIVQGANQRSISATHYIFAVPC